MMRSGLMTRVISLPSRPERLRAFERQWAASGWWSVLGIPTVHVHDAVDGQAGSMPVQWEPYGRGAWGCWASHLDLLMLAHARGQAVLVFEDDAVLAPASADVFAAALEALPADATGLWLGGQLVDSALEERGDGPIFRVRRAPLRTHAYLLTRAGVDRALRHLPHVVTHVDLALECALAGTPVYAVHPWLAGQSAGRSDITDDHEPERWWPLDPARTTTRSC